VSAPLRFLLLTSTDTSAAALTRLGGLVASIDAQGMHGDHVVVLRGFGEPELPPCDSMSQHPVWVPFDTSLAAARNLALDYARDHGLMELADVVGFPDDDCRYAGGSLARVAEFIRGGDAVVCVPYAPAPESIDRRRFPASDGPLSPARVMRAASCAGCFFPAWAIGAVGDFDERYGLGARFGASEDTDYVLRVLAAGFSGSYRGGRALVEHPYKSYRSAQYYIGNVAVLAKHAGRGGTAYLLLRRLLYGALLMAGRRISVHDYLRALRATGELVGSPPPVRLPAATGRSAPSPRTSAPDL
jgi:glycosyltransferase involved in cell wall biosynthesis